MMFGAPLLSPVISTHNEEAETQLGYRHLSYHVIHTGIQKVLIDYKINCIYPLWITN